MKGFLKSLVYLACCGFFSLAGFSFAKGFEGVGMIFGFLFGTTVVNFLDLGTKYYQAAYYEKLKAGHQPIED